MPSQQLEHRQASPCRASEPSPRRRHRSRRPRLAQACPRPGPKGGGEAGWGSTRRRRRLRPGPPRQRGSAVTAASRAQRPHSAAYPRPPPRRGLAGARPARHPRPSPLPASLAFYVAVKTPPASPPLLSVGEVCCQSRPLRRASQLPRRPHSPARRRGGGCSMVLSCHWPPCAVNHPAPPATAAPLAPSRPFCGRPRPAPFPSFLPSTLLAPPS